MEPLKTAVPNAGFRWLLLLAALTLSAITGFFSVTGFAANFGGATPLLAIGAGLEVGKLVVVSYLHRFGRQTFWLFRWLATFVAVALVAASSVGIFGYLTADLDKHLIDRQAHVVVVDRLQAELTTLQGRLTQLDNQLAELPPETVRGRVKLYNTFKAERETLTADIATKQAALTTRQSQLDESNRHVGTVRSIAAILNIQVETALFVFAVLVTAVFDPLAILLFLFYNVARDSVLAEQGRIADTRAAVDVAIAEAKAAVAAELATALPACQTELAALAQQHADHMKEVQALRDTVAALPDSSAELQQLGAALAEANRVAANLTSRLDDVSRAAQSAAKEAQTCVKRHQTLDEGSAVSQRRVSELAQQLNELANRFDSVVTQQMQPAAAAPSIDVGALAQQVTSAVLTQLDSADRNRDGVVDASELAALRDAVAKLETRLSHLQTPTASVPMARVVS